MTTGESVLYAKGLYVTYRSPRGDVRAVVGADFYVKTGEIVALVGGSGSGKSTAAMAIGRLTDFMPCSVEGILQLRGRNVLSMGPKEIREVRRHDVSYVFQEPASSLNPVLTIREQIREALDEPSDSAVADLLASVKISDPARVAKSFPHQLSGGMKQRVMIAIALAKEPALLVADEPTTALDVTIQKEILQLFLEFKTRRNLSMLFITHDIRLAAFLSDRILVMHQGKVVEEIADPKNPNPGHPYAQRLLAVARAGAQPKAYFDV